MLTSSIKSNVVHVNSTQKIICKFQKIEEVLFACTIQEANLEEEKEPYLFRFSGHPFKKGLSDVTVFDVNPEKIFNPRKVTVKFLNHQMMKKFKNLEILALNNVELEEIALNSFVDNEKLKFLLLEHNNIVALPSGVFKPCKNVKILQLRGNKIKEIQKENFQGLENLKILAMEENEISSIDGSTFEDFANLGELLLSNNNISEIHSNAFKNLKNLVKLDLSGNRISQLPHGIFGNLEYIKQLLITDNQIQILSVKSFGFHDKLQILDFSSNLIAEIDPKLLKDFPNFETFDLSENVCINETINSENQMALKNCFVNYVEEEILVENLQISTDGYQILDGLIAVEKKVEEEATSGGERSLMGFGVGFVIFSLIYW